MKAIENVKNITKYDEKILYFERSSRHFSGYQSFGRAHLKTEETYIEHKVKNIMFCYWGEGGGGAVLD